MPQKDYIVQINKIYCGNPSDGSGADNLKIIITADGDMPAFFPIPYEDSVYMSAGNSYYPPDTPTGRIRVPVNHRVLISLWDGNVFQDMDLYDFNGSVSLAPQPKGTVVGPLTCSNGDNSSYDVTVEWLDGGAN